MESVNAERCAAHVCICTNQKPDGRICCANVGGQEFFQRVKTKMKDSGLASKYWVTRTGCLGFCNDVGTTVVIHKPGKESEWFHKVVDADFETIWNRILEER